jgi:glycosyltransferase involved in cell wall biosynthesis
MSDGSKILTVIPYYNHESTLRQVVEGCLRHTQDVLVIDDCSAVPAAGLLEGVKVSIVRHEVNKGKGKAILTAGFRAKELGFSHIVTLDADAQHEPDDLPLFFDAIQRNPMRIYVGHRDFEAANVPGSSKFGRKFSNFWYRLQTGHSLKDCQSGFRAYPVITLTELRFLFLRYAFEVEVLVRSTWGGVPCEDIDIRVYYPEADQRISHFRKGRDNLMLTILNTHLTFRAILPWPHKKLHTKEPEGRVSLMHPLRSLKTLLIEHASPPQLAFSASIGMFLGVIPLLFVHTLSIVLACNYFRVNKPLAVAVSQLCMPPLMPALCIEVGHYIRHGRWLTEFTLETLGHQGLERLWEWILGSLFVAPIFTAITWVVVWSLSRSLQNSLKLSPHVSQANH